MGAEALEYFLNKHREVLVHKENIRRNILKGCAMKEEVLSLRKLGLTIAEIVNRTGYRLTQVCEVIYSQNEEDIANDH